jgi:hypothetical protein
MITHSHCDSVLFSKKDRNLVPVSLLVSLTLSIQIRCDRSPDRSDVLSVKRTQSHLENSLSDHPTPVGNAVDEERPRPNIRLRKVSSNRFELLLDDAPPPAFVHMLQMAPRQREPDLDRGAWLVLVFSPVSAPDVRSIKEAIGAVQRVGRGIQLGIRPFYDYEETLTWYGRYGDPESPLWVIINRGYPTGESRA